MGCGLASFASALQYKLMFAILQSATVSNGAMHHTPLQYCSSKEETILP